MNIRIYEENQKEVKKQMNEKMNKSVQGLAIHGRVSSKKK